MMTVIPAYGRDYRTAKAAKADWDANLDFRIADHFSPWDGKYVNKEQVPGQQIMIRFCDLTKVTIAKGGL